MSFFVNKEAKQINALPVAVGGQREDLHSVFEPPPVFFLEHQKGLWNGQ